MTYRHSSVCGECREVSSAIGPRRPASRTEPQTCGVRIWRKVKNLLYPHSQPLVQQAGHVIPIVSVLKNLDLQLYVFMVCTRRAYLEQAGTLFAVSWNGTLREL